MCKMISKYRKIIVFTIVIIIFIPLTPFRALLFAHAWMNIDSSTDGIPPLYVSNDNNNPRNSMEALNIAYKNATVTGGTSYWSMIKRYPDNSALYAIVLQYYMKREGSELLYISSKSKSKNKYNEQETRSEIKESPILDKALYAIKMGEKLEPDNAYFKVFHAYLLFGLGRDQDSINMLNSAAKCKLYNSHCNDLIKARIKYGPKLAAPVDWFFPSRKYIVGISTAFPQLMPFMKYFKFIIFNTKKF